MNEDNKEQKKEVKTISRAEKYYKISLGILTGAFIIALVVGFFVFVLLLFAGGSGGGGFGIASVVELVIYTVGIIFGVIFLNFGISALIASIYVGRKEHKFVLYLYLSAIAITALVIGVKAITDWYKDIPKTLHDFVDICNLEEVEKRIDNNDIDDKDKQYIEGRIISKIVSCKNLTNNLVSKIYKYGASDPTIILDLIERKKQKYLEFFLEAGVNPNQTLEDGRNAIMMECPLYLVKMLHKAGLDLNAKDNMGRNALFYCTDGDSLKYLLENGADPTVLDNEGNNALGFELAREEIYNEQPDNIVKEKAISKIDILIKAGVDVFHKNKIGDTILINLMKLDVRRKMYGYRSSFSAAYHAIINAGVDVNATSNDGTTALHHATELDWLIEDGANVNARDNKGRTPLYYSIKEGCVYDCFSLLCKNGASIDNVDSYGLTPEAYLTALENSSDNHNINNGNIRREFTEYCIDPNK